MRRRRQPNLRLLPTALIGRDDEVTAACDRLRAGSGRLVTFTGPPGVGKTSLALTVAQELASRFRHGVRVIDLAPIEDAAGVAAAIAEGLGVRRSNDDLPLEGTIRFLHDRRLLLVLDNFEQVVVAARSRRPPPSAMARGSGSRRWSSTASCVTSSQSHGWLRAARPSRGFVCWRRFDSTRSSG